ncbi:MAG: AAA family ATPase, partial [Rhodospirillaceae bacterium]|nr:AAA family ATPase [Rhodospirillaceae bacterium]
MYPRFMERQVREALKDTRVVLLCGPRQSGKTTLAQRIAGDAIPFFTLDDATTLEASLSEPAGFLRGLDRAVIDEIQR